MSLVAVFAFALGIQDAWSLVDERENQQAGVKVQLYVDQAEERGDLVLGDRLKFKVVASTTSSHDVDVSIGHAKCACSLSDRPPSGVATAAAPFESIGGIFVEEGKKYLRLGVHATPASGIGRKIELEYEYFGHNPFRFDVGAVIESDASGVDRPKSLVVSVTRRDGVPTSGVTLDRVAGYSARKDLDLGDSVWTLTPHGDHAHLMHELVLPPTRVFSASGGVLAVVHSDEWKRGRRIFPKPLEIGSQVVVRLTPPDELGVLADCFLVGPPELMIRRVSPLADRAGVQGPVEFSLQWMGTESLAPGGYPVEFDLMLVGSDSKGAPVVTRQSLWFE